MGFGFWVFCETQSRLEFVETILGEPVREDGPILGIEFDPVPPGAFGTPIVKATMQQEQQRQSGLRFGAIICEQSNGNLDKRVSRTPHEYHFLPAQLTARTETCEGVVPTYHHDSPHIDANDRTLSNSTSSDRTSSDKTSSAKTLSHRTSSNLTSSDRTSSDRTSSDVTSSDETAVSHYALQMQREMSGLKTMSKQRRKDPLSSSAPAYRDNFLQQNSAINISIQPHYRQCSSYQTNNRNIISEQRVINEEEFAQLERKRKSEEISIEQELQAQEKKVRKKIEKRDILLRKREEQIRKGLERHKRVKQKEEEIPLSERPNDETCQREQKRKPKRRDKLLQKESPKAEKMRQKDELRRENGASHMKTADEREIAHKNLTILANILLGEDS